jgi:methylmalonyl-CoA/ethylmalonyl-CoA epimerase
MSATPAIDSLHQVAVPSSDLARSVAFYRDTLGLAPIAIFEPPGLAFFALGSTRLLVDAAASQRPAGGVLYFRVADIHASCERLRARGVPIESGPHAIHRDDAGTFGAAGEEEWMAFFRDPDGNVLALASRIQPARR